MDEGRLTGEGTLNIVSSDEESVILEQRGETDVSAGSRDALFNSSEVVVQPLHLLANRFLRSEVRSSLQPTVNRDLGWLGKDARIE